jgi:hypothetical protein
MIVLQLAPALLSLVVLGAHFLRAGDLVLLFGVLLVVALLAVPRRWAARLVQLALVLGALEWVRTLLHLVAARSAAGQPIARLIVILACVASLTALSALAFRTARLRQRYR